MIMNTSVLLFPRTQMISIWSTFTKRSPDTVPVPCAPGRLTPPVMANISLDKLSCPGCYTASPTDNTGKWEHLQLSYHKQTWADEMFLSSPSCSPVTNDCSFNDQLSNFIVSFTPGGNVPQDLPFSSLDIRYRTSSRAVLGSLCMCAAVASSEHHRHTTSDTGHVYSYKNVSKQN